MTQHTADSTLETMRAAQRAYAADPTPAAREAMIAAQRAHDAEREASRERAEFQETLDEAGELVARVRERLAGPAPELTGDLYLVTPSVAEWAGMAPAVAGGWIAVDLELTTDLLTGEALGRRSLPLYLADLPDAFIVDAYKAVPRSRAQAWLRACLEIYTRAPEPWMVTFEDEVGEMLAVLDLVEGGAS